MGRSTRRVELLEYLIRSEVDGDGDKLKAYVIGLDVFGKLEDFDPANDSIVRVEIGRLRTALALFEASEHATSSILVDIPVGTYRPILSRRAVVLERARIDGESIPDRAPVDETGEETLETDLGRKRSIPVVVAALLFVVVCGVLISNFIGKHGASEISRYPVLLTVEQISGDELSRSVTSLLKSNFASSSVVKVLETDEDKPGATRFKIKGFVERSVGKVSITIELTNISDNSVEWSRTFVLDDQFAIDGDLEAALNRTVVGELQTRLLGAAKRSLEIRDPTELSAEQLFLLATWVSGPAESSMKWETERVYLMNLALEKKAEYGLAHSVLADKYSFLANVYEPWDTRENRELAIFHAQRAEALSPLDSNAMFNVAQSYWHAGKMAKSQRIFKRVTELDPANSLAQFFSVLVPYWCGSVPDDIMKFAIDFDDHLSADDPIRWIVLTWIATLHANRGELELALKAATDAAQIFQVGYTYMVHAMLLNRLGRLEEAIDVLKRQEYNWPGVSPKHYSEATVPRQCQEQQTPEDVIANYKMLAEKTLTIFE